MSVQPVLIKGQWAASAGTETFQALNPKTREMLPERYPVSPWAEVERAIVAADAAAKAARSLSGEHFARFLEVFADKIEARKSEFVAIAHAETAQPVTPRLQDAELPRTTNQLRQAAAAAREGSWALPTIDTKANIRSVLGPIGPVAVFGPNNFPFAFNSAALDGNAQAALRRQADFIRQFPELRFRVYGHTDLVGSNAYNKSLGMRRARAVVGYLSTLGISRSRLEAVVSYGETQPLVLSQGPE
ncbi:MAG: aldehyde dehydrogenase family protein, partial [Desulfobacterales bacterium]|nr:aldehyde dehydrogenase family protein [Desulfobacterales bacterium]